MKKIPIKVWKSFFFATLIGVSILTFIHLHIVEIYLSQSLQEIFRDIGISFIVAGLISLIYEWSTRTAEKLGEMRTIVETFLKTFIPDKIWKEIENEVLLRKVFRSNLKMEIEIFESEIKIGQDNISIPTGKAVIKTKVNYDLYSVSSFDDKIKIRHFLDWHMRNDEMNLPRFTSMKINDGSERLFTDENLTNLFDSKLGCLTIEINEPKFSKDKGISIGVERYELVNIPGLYTLVMPEMVIPSDDINSSISISFINDENIRKDLNITINNWFNSVGHNFLKTGQKYEWKFNKVMLPGQGFSIVFSNQ